jgi:deoxyribonuclease V
MRAAAEGLRSPTPAEAVALQRRLAQRVVRAGRPRVRTVCGADTSVRAGVVSAALCVFTFPGLEPVESASARRPVGFPYVPGLLAFRELPALRAAWRRLARAPDLLLVDGHGLAHPRRCGIACHLGLELDRPAIGVGKSLLVGEHRPPSAARGSRARLLHRGEVVGTVLRTRTAVAPVYVSIGHRIELAEAVRIVLACARRYRLPEPIRAADHLAGAGSRGTEETPLAGPA